MTLFDDEGKELEEIKLYELQTRDEMHQLLVDKGFTKKTVSQKATDAQLAQMEKALNLSPSPLASSAGSTYLMLCGAIFGE